MQANKSNTVKRTLDLNNPHPWPVRKRRVWMP